jgi:chromosomal replication initiation ATPase DnaA
LISRRGHLNISRNVAIYLFRSLRGDDLNSIKDAFKIKTCSTVSSIVQKTAHLKATSGKIRKDIQSIENRIIASSAS